MGKRVLNFSISDKLENQLRADSKNSDIAMSEIIRRALEMYFGERDRELLERSVKMKEAGLVPGV